MPGPIIGTQGFDNPPEEMQLILGANAYQYFVMIHNLLFKARANDQGNLDETNIAGDLSDTTDHGDFTNIQPYQHHGSDNHGDLKQAAHTQNATFANVSVASPDAGAAYTAAEQALINEIKSDVNTLGTSTQSIGTAVNNLLAALRAAGLTT